MINDPEILINEERWKELTMYGIARTKNYEEENYLTCYKIIEHSTMIFKIGIEKRK